MGIVNVTPDSFSDGGEFASAAAANAHAELLLAQGADILDIGAESTRPGALGISFDDEWRRLEPVLRHAVTLGCPVSADTSSPRVISACLELGVDIINDVRALRRPGALEALASDSTAGVCLMHMQGEPATMQANPSYRHVVSDVSQFLQDRLLMVERAGVSLDRVVLDPGFGFGKSLEHNLELSRGMAQLCELGRPLLAGWSRKSILGQLTGKVVQDRLLPSVIAAMAALSQGASILRVHDVAETVEALKIWRGLTPPSQADMRQQKPPTAAHQPQNS